MKVKTQMNKTNIFQHKNMKAKLQATLKNSYHENSYTKSQTKCCKRIFFKYIKVILMTKKLKFKCEDS